jgi:uncharacterized protein Yka (UPF0111/DUF47 family)
MTEKKRIIDDLGEAALLLPAAVNDGLLANDRVKYLFTLLQNAVSHADNPANDVSNLHKERLTCDIDDNALDDVVANSRLLADGNYQIPMASSLLGKIHAQLNAMLDPLSLAEGAGITFDENTNPDQYRVRLDSLVTLLPDTSNDTLNTGIISTIIRGTRDHGDSMHLLVMDLHKELNRLQALMSEESLAGANVYQINENDRPLVKAFMDGLNRTAPLKFDHPGLGTTATRVGDKLVLQNDIGTTDAHVLVIHVIQNAVTVTYTDIHPERMKFFISLFDPFDVTWNETSTHTDAGLEEENYYLRIGSYNARDNADLERYLAFVGSRLVFLIDWNKARKRLRNFVKNKDAISLLKWSADRNFGHRGFLVLGGENLIYQAIEYAAKSVMHYGQPLHEVLGRDQAIIYLRFVLEKASTGLISGQSKQLLRDEIKTELLKYFHTAFQSLLNSAERHAEIIYDIAHLTQGSLLRASQSNSKRYIQKTADRCRHLEHRADDQLNEARSSVRNNPGTSLAFIDIIELADDAADNLEETAYLLTLLPDNNTTPDIFAELNLLSAQVVQTCQEYIKCLESASHVHRGGASEDMDDFLQAVDHIVKLEHDTDDTHRKITKIIVDKVNDCRLLHLFSQIAKSMEETADALSISGLKLREHVLDELMTS